MVEAAAVFNGSDGLRTMEGITRSLGPPQVSIVALSGSSPTSFLTLVWDLRLVPVSDQPGPRPSACALTDRGTSPRSSRPRSPFWNAASSPGSA